VVKPGVEYSDVGGDISGWQGRISAIRPPNNTNAATVDVQWDSITLANIPESVIVDCELGGFYWSWMGLLADEVAPTEARDSELAVERTIEKLSSQYGWIAIGDDEAQGRRIQAVVNSAESTNAMDVFEAWQSYLETNLKLPFKATVYEVQERGPIRSNSTVMVRQFSDIIDEQFGILVNIKYKRKNYTFPLCDLVPETKKSANYPFSHEYNVWFANR
jgi:hypothetical protein